MLEAAERTAALAAKALAGKKDAAVHVRDTTASAVPMLAKDKRRQEEAAAQQRRAEADCVTVPV
jgi:hypothetical protein